MASANPCKESRENRCIDEAFSQTQTSRRQTTSGAGNPLRFVMPERKRRTGIVMVFQSRARRLPTGRCGAEKISAVRFGNTDDFMAGFMVITGLVYGFMGLWVYGFMGLSILTYYTLPAIFIPLLINIIAYL